jgi:PPM family protein phosphatase
MISFHSETDLGRRRSLNEDAVLAGDGLFIVCDGMGGHKAGEVASQLAVDVITRFVKRSAEDSEITWPFGFLTRTSLDGNRLRTAIKLANRAVLGKAASSNEYTGMGTTVAAMIVSRHQPQMTYASVGDSRIYLVRAGAIVQLTRDDSWANLSWDAEMVDEATKTGMQHVLTKALGAGEDIDFEVKSQDLRDGDTVLLCSDGVSNMVPDPRILEILSEHGADLERACQQLVSEANTHGGRDNISAILVRYGA